MADEAAKKCTECGCLQGHTIDCPEFGLDMTPSRADRQMLVAQRKKRQQDFERAVYDPLPIEDGDPYGMIFDAFDSVPRRITRLA